jgi:hypothetical protein
MKCLILILLLSCPLIPLVALEFTDHESASGALYNNNSNIDIEGQVFFGFRFGASEDDIIKKIGNPSALYEMKDIRNLYYGRDVVLSFRNGKLSGLTAGNRIAPYQIDRMAGSSPYPPWRLGKIKFLDKKKLVEESLGLKNNELEQFKHNQIIKNDIKIQFEYAAVKEKMNNLIEYEQEYLTNIKIEKIEANNTDSPNGEAP